MCPVLLVKCIIPINVSCRVPSNFLHGSCPPYLATLLSTCPLMYYLYFISCAPSMCGCPTISVAPAPLLSCLHGSYLISLHVSCPVRLPSAAIFHFLYYCRLSITSLLFCIFLLYTVQKDSIFQRGQCILLSVVFTLPPPSHHGSV